MNFSHVQIMKCIVGYSEVGPKILSLHIKYQKGFITSSKFSAIIAMKKHFKVVHDTLIWKSFWRMQVIDHKTKNGQMYPQLLFFKFFFSLQINIFKMMQCKLGLWKIWCFLWLRNYCLWKFWIHLAIGIGIHVMSNGCVPM